MILRLVLVGMVGALGVSIPAQPGCEHWYGSAQAWATSLLAQWDTWEPACDDDGGPRLVVTQNQVDCEECRLARMRLLAGTHEESKTEESLAQKIAEIGPPKSGAEKSTDGPAGSAARGERAGNLGRALPDRHRAGRKRRGHEFRRASGAGPGSPRPLIYLRLRRPRPLESFRCGFSGTRLKRCRIRL